MDGWGRIHQDLVKGVVPIEFPHRRVVPAHTIELKLPETTMLCTLEVDAVDSMGNRVATNFIQLYADGGLPASREDTERTTILRAFPSDWSDANWSGGMCRREDARGLHFAWGMGCGYFDYHFPLSGIDLKKARRLRVLFEASSRRVDTPQTTNDRHPSALNVELNGVLVNRQIIVDHPHDARGALSYLSGGKRGRGAFGYLISTAIDGNVLAQVAEKAGEGLHLRCAVPEKELASGGLTLYDTEAGRYPIALLCVIEW